MISKPYEFSPLLDAPPIFSTRLMAPRGTSSITTTSCSRVSILLHSPTESTIHTSNHRCQQFCIDSEKYPQFMVYRKSKKKGGYLLSSWSLGSYSGCQWGSWFVLPFLGGSQSQKSVRFYSYIVMIGIHFSRFWSWTTHQFHTSSINSEIFQKVLQT